jgi:hypothetical protein
MMNCEDFEREWQELDDPSLFSPAMEEHQTTCAPCAARIRDVNRIRWEARQLIATEEPPDRLWLNLRRELDKEGLIREPGAQSWLSAVTTFDWLPRFQMGLATASVFFLVLGAMYWQLVLVPGLTPPPTPPTATVQKAPEPAATPAEASKQQVVAQNKEDEVVQRMIKTLSPESQATVARNWEQLKDSEDTAQRYFNAHPDDPLALEQVYIGRQFRTHFVGTLTRAQE